MRYGQGWGVSQVTELMACVRKPRMLLFKSCGNLTELVRLCGRRVCFGRRSHYCVWQNSFVLGENIAVFAQCLATIALKREPHMVTVQLLYSSVRSIDTSARYLTAHSRGFSAWQHVINLCHGC